MAKRKQEVPADQDNEKRLASLWQQRFKQAMIHKAPYTKRWQDYWDAYSGDYFKKDKKPEYKSDLVSNYVFSTVETIRPLMLDNDPQFQAFPNNPEAMNSLNDLQAALTYEWRRTRMNTKLSRDLITTLVTGTSVFFIPWDSDKKNIDAVRVDPLNLFPDPLATCIEDAEYLIYATYKSVERLKRKYPKFKEQLSGSSINYSELVNENDKDAKILNQVLLLEVWTHDFDDELMEGETKKFPNGRQLLIAPELSLVLEDKENPYNESEFPFVLIKDYDVPGKFWGEGEVAQLLSPQKHMNELSNAIVDNAKTTANMPWIVDKNAGIGYGKITGRPGLVIRKNPGTEVRREAPPSMPLYVINAVETFKQDIEQISGIFNSVKGNSDTGVYTAQGVLALQEAGQLRIRIKVKVMEEGLGRMARMFHSRMKQFWTEDRWVLYTEDNGEVDMKKLPKQALNFDYNLHVSAGSTMPVNRNAMLDLMIRLAQTQMPDGEALVDRAAVVHYLPTEVRAALLERMDGHNQSMEQMQQGFQQLVEQVQAMAQEIQQQLEQVKQESDQNDEQHISMIEEVAKALETLQGQIIQEEQAHAKLMQEREEEKKTNDLRSKSYNEGFSDAERMSQQELQELGLDAVQGLEEDGEIPQELLDALEELSDEELAILLDANPDLASLFQPGETVADTHPITSGTTPY